MADNHIDPSAAPAPLPRPPPIPAFLGRMVEPFYRRAITGRNRRFDSGRGVTRLDVPVVSIGNLSVGGTGKTPMVAHVVGVLLRAGHRPCIAMRGYGKRHSSATDHAPDETDAYRRLFPDVAVVAQPDRLAGIHRLFETTPAAARPTCIVLDDGFQHRRIARGMDVVLIDASRSPFEDRLLPAGWQREPVESMARATHVVISHAEMTDQACVQELDRLVAQARGNPAARADAVTRHAWTGLVISGAGPSTESVEPLDWLLGKRVVAACAIGNPEGFLHSLRVTLSEDEHNAGTLAATMVLPDHDPFCPDTVRSLAKIAEDQHADAIVVTDKDWSKLRHVPPGTWRARPIVRPQLALAFNRGGSEFDAAVLAACSGRK